MKHAKGENIIFFSGDGNEDPKDIPKVVKYLNQGNDLVIAGRFIFRNSQSDDSDDPIKFRKIFNYICSTLVRVIWKSGVRDSINGFRGMKRSAMDKMNLDVDGFEKEFQSPIRAAKLMLKIKEFPTNELLRLGGQKKPTCNNIILAYRFFRFFIKEILIGNKFKEIK